MNDNIRPKQFIRASHEALDDAKAILAITGGSMSPEGERLAERIVADEITDEQAIAELLRQHS